MKIENYYLNLTKVMNLEDKEERDQIHSYYKDMLYSFQDDRKETAISILNTLLNAGFLIDSRDDKIERILG